MSETLEYCTSCDPPAPVKRVVSKNFNIRRNSASGAQKPGTVVKQYIKDVQKELKEEKNRLSKEEYNKK